MLEEVVNVIFGFFAVFVLPGLLYEWVEKIFWKDSLSSPPQTNSIYFSPNALQRRLDAWIKVVATAKGTNKWKFGRDYERYIGYLLELGGYHVIYNGALWGKSDGGIDLFAFKDGYIHLVQCKRWRNRIGVEAIEKFAKAVETFKRCRYMYEEIIPSSYANCRVMPLFYTTSDYTDKALELAESEGIIPYTREFNSIREYPPVKCTIKDGRKVYYLPFDKEFDRIAVGVFRGGCYKFNVFEAEKLGYRYIKNPEQVVSAPPKNVMVAKPEPKKSHTGLKIFAGATAGFVLIAFVSSSSTDRKTPRLSPITDRLNCRKPTRPLSLRILNEYRHL